MKSWKKRILSAVVALSVAAAGIGTFPQIDIPVYATEPEEQNIEYSGETLSISLEDDGVTGEDMINNYVEKQFNDALNAGRVRLLRGTTSAGASLSGVDAYVYNKLKTFIESVAAGNESSAQTTLSLSELATYLGLSLSYNFADEGVTQAWTGNELSNAAKAKIAEKQAPFDFTISNVMNALLADCPYELYWFDKESGCSYTQNGFAGGYSVSGDVFTITGNFTIGYDVSRDYSASGAIGTTAVNTTKTTNVNNLMNKVAPAVSKAQSIVNSATGSVYDRLETYKNEICDLVSYNTTAVEDDDYPYGDPWQLVYVFDEDPDTNVVCEGYSKAFKYLCDLSNFTNASCILVSGVMGGGTGAGAHMWNIVNMDDNKSYLVDVTNCDTGTIGYPDKLFMAIPTSEIYNEQYDYTQYNFKCGSSTISYVYDPKMVTTFGSELLTFSTTPYSAPLNKVEGVSISLGGEIGVNFYVSAPPDTIVAGAKAVLTGPNGVETHTLSGLTRNSSGQYKLTYRVNATQMDEDVTIQIKNSGDDVLPLYDYQCERYADDSRTFSVYTYCNNSTVSSGNATYNIIKATKTYGAYAAKYFNGTALPEGINDLPNTETVKSAAAGYAWSASGTAPGGIQILGTTLVLNSETYARLYFTATDLSGITITVDGIGAVTPGSKGGNYYIEIANISANHLTDKYTVRFGDSFTVVFSAMSYVYSTLNNEDDADLINVAKAVYVYAEKADAYAG